MNHVDRNTFRGTRGMPGNYYPQPSCGNVRQGRQTCGCDSCEQKQEICPHACDQRGGFDQSFALAMAYVPLQEWIGISAPCEGLENGTVFSELVKPFCRAGRRGGR